MRKAKLLCLTLCLALFIGAPPRAQGEADQAAFIDELLAVAAEELGYTRSANGYTKYADWSGANKYSEWCSNFVSWCVDQADQRLGVQRLGELYPMQTACITGVKWFTARGRYVTATGVLKGYGAQWYRSDGAPLAGQPYVPRRGDLIYFEWYKYNRIDHVGIVEDVTEDADGGILIHTIEGNPRDYNYVRRFTYPLDDPSIRAYGVTEDTVGTDLRPGSTGPMIEELQRLLIQGGWGNFRISDFFGKETTAAVKALQHSLGLEPTGIADYPVQKALGFGFEG